MLGLKRVHPDSAAAQGAPLNAPDSAGCASEGSSRGAGGAAGGGAGGAANLASHAESGAKTKREPSVSVLSLRERVAAFAQEQRAAAATASMGAMAPDALAGEATGLQIEEMLEEWKSASRREFEAALSQHVPNCQHLFGKIHSEHLPPRRERVAGPDRVKMLAAV